MQQKITACPVAVGLYTQSPNDACHKNNQWRYCREIKESIRMPTEQVLEIVIPQGVRPGSKLNVPVGDGRTYEIIVPDNVSPGDHINVVIPSIDVTTEENVSSQTPTTMTSSSIALGAAAAGGILATLVVGPVTGIIVAGVALYATTRNDAVGDVARATGAATNVVYDKAVQAEKKYSITDRLMSAGSATIKKAKEIDNEYKIADKTKSALSQIATQAKEIDEKYEITSKASKAVASGINAVTKTSSPRPSGAMAAPDIPVAEAHVVQK
eukprot:gene788-1527_t